MRNQQSIGLTVTVSVQDLIARVTENRNNHRAIFEKALNKFHAVAIAAFEERIDRIKAGKDFDLFVRLAVPEDHTEDYDRVIDMLTMHANIHYALAMRTNASPAPATIEISSSDFACFVRDDWEWKEQWATTNASYGL